MTTMPVPPQILADRPMSPSGLPQPPQDFADHRAPGLAGNDQPRDLLSELLQSVRLNGERIVAYGPLRTFSVGFAGIGTLHIVDQGEILLRIDGVPHVERVSHGDVILLPRGDPHHIVDAGNDGASPPTRWLCGTFTIGDPQASHLLASLPAAIVLRGDRGPALEGLELARRCPRPSDRRGPERRPPRSRPRLEGRGTGPGVLPFPVGLRGEVRSPGRNAAGRLSHARTPRRRYRPAA
jgi:hypothetical protein